MVIMMPNGEPFRLWTMTIVNNSNSLILSITKCHIGMHKIEIQYQLFEIVWKRRYEVGKAQTGWIMFPNVQLILEIVHVGRGQAEFLGIRAELVEPFLVYQLGVRERTVHAVRAHCAVCRYTVHWGTSSWTLGILWYKRCCSEVIVALASYCGYQQYIKINISIAEERERGLNRVWLWSQKIWIEFVD